VRLFFAMARKDEKTLGGLARKIYYFCAEIKIIHKRDLYYETHF